MYRYLKFSTLLLIMGLCLGGMLFTAQPGYAQQANGNAGSNNVCVSAQQFQTPQAGQQIINSIFDTINTILADVGENFYNSVINNPNFQAVVGALVVLYVAIYGGLILFNMASYRTSEVVVRLVKIGIVYAIVTSGWQFFSTYVGNLFMGGMNELITNFATASNGGITAVGNGDVVDTNGNPQLSTSAMTILTDANPNVAGSDMGILSMVFSAKMWVAVSSVFTLKDFGWLLGLCMIWALIDFILLIVGAIGTYVKSVVGLTFLFGIAPIFFLFLLFEKTRQIFQGWLNQVISFALQPVMLFAFLSFYITLLTSAVYNMLYAQGTTPDWCFTQWTAIPGTPLDPQAWRPNAYPDPQTGQLVDKLSGDWIQNFPNGGGGGTTAAATAPPPISMIQVFYFLLLSHLGKSFCDVIEQLSQDISQGSGGGIIRGSDIGSSIKNNFMGGRGPTARAMDVGSSGLRTIGRLLTGGQQK